MKNVSFFMVLARLLYHQSRKFLFYGRLQFKRSRPVGVKAQRRKNMESLLYRPRGRQVYSKKISIEEFLAIKQSCNFWLLCFQSPLLRNQNQKEFLLLCCCCCWAVLGIQAFYDLKWLTLHPELLWSKMADFGPRAFML